VDFVQKSASPDSEKFRLLDTTIDSRELNYLDLCATPRLRAAQRAISEILNNKRNLRLTIVF
jgi:hypothetical protein